MPALPAITYVLEAVGMTRRYPGPSIGDVHASMTKCTVLDANGEACGRPGSPRLPIGVCEACACVITRAVLRLGGITVEEKR